jgi:hypothetical protein
MKTLFFIALCLITCGAHAQTDSSRQIVTWRVQAGDYIMLFNYFSTAGEMYEDELDTVKVDFRDGSVPANSDTLQLTVEVRLLINTLRWLRDQRYENVEKYYKGLETTIIKSGLQSTYLDAAVTQILNAGTNWTTNTRQEYKRRLRGIRL